MLNCSNRYRALRLICILFLLLIIAPLSVVEAVQQFVPTEVIQLKWGSDSGEVGFLKLPGGNYGPQSFALDEAGQVYILDSSNQRILIYSPSGNLVSTFLIEERGDDLCLGGNNNIYVLFRAKNEVVEYINGTFITKYPLADPASPVVGIDCNNQSLSFETADGHSYPLVRNGKEVDLESQSKGKTLGLHRNNSYFLLERKNQSQGTINILDNTGKIKEKIAVRKKSKGNIETLAIIGMDDRRNIYIVVEESSPSFEIKRFLQKYNPEGLLVAEALIPYSAYAYTHKELRVTRDGTVYQIIPLKEYVKLLKWSVGDTSEASSELYEFYRSLFSYVYPLSEDFLPGDSIDIIGTEQLEVESQNFFIYAASTAQNEIMSRAESYRTHSFYVSSSSITPSGGTYCGGKIVKTPVSSPGWYGVLYKWGGFSGLTGVTSCTNDVGYCYDEGLSAGKYAGDKCTASDSDCSGIYYGSSCAVGVDCSGFVSRTWNLSTKQSTTDFSNLISTCSLGSMDYLVAGDILNSTSAGHTMLFQQRETNGTYTVYEASAKDWKVSYGNYSASYLNSYSYYPYRYKNLTGVFQVNDSVQTNGDVNVRSCASTSCDPPICQASTGDTGKVVSGPQEGNGYTWWQITWNTGSCSGKTGWSIGCRFQKTTPPPPNPPTNLVAVGSSNNILIQWDDNSNNETGFKIERKTGLSGSYSEIKKVGTNVNAYKDEGLFFGNIYCYRVRAYNDSGDSAYSNESCATALATPELTSPDNGAIINTNSVTLKWNYVLQAEGYGVDVSRTSCGGEDVLNIATTYNSHTLSNLLDGTYYWQIQAFNNTYKGISLPACREFTIDTTPPTLGPPQIYSSNVYESYYSGSSVNIRATASDTQSGINGATCEYSVNNGTNWNSASWDGTYCYKTGVGVSGTINLKFMVKDNANNPGTSTTATYYQDNSTPTVGVSGAPASWQNTDATASVSCSDGGSGCSSTTYRLKMYSSNPGSCPADYNAYDKTSPQTVSSYSWACGTAKDNLGNTGYSAPIEFKVDKVLPTDGNLDAIPGNRQVSLNWNGFSDSGGSGLRSMNTYKVVRSTGSYPNSQCTSGDQVYLGSGNSTTDTGLTNGTTYYYRACAYDNAGNVSIGATASATPQPTDTIIVGDGTSPANKYAGPLNTNKAVSAFTLSTNTGTDTVTAVTVTGANMANVSSVKIYQDNGTAPNEWDSGDTLKGSLSSPTSPATVTVSGITTTTTQTQYLIVYDFKSNPTDGQTLTAYVSAITAGNDKVYNDNEDAIITIDASAPTTTDNQTSSSWQSTEKTVILTPNDGTGSGVTTSTGIYGCFGTGCTPIVLGSNTMTSFCGTGNECTYDVKYYSKDNVGNTENTKTSAYQARIDSKAPTPGTSFDISSGDALCSLNWSAASDSGSGLHSTESYEVRYQAGSDPGSCNGGSRAYIGTGLSYDHENLTNGTIYYYRLCYKDNVLNQSHFGVTKICTPTPPPQVTITATDPNAAEPSDTGTFTVSRTGSTTSSLTVYYTTSGTAVPDSDYTVLSGSVTILSGSSTATISVNPIDDASVEDNETVIVAISLDSAYQIGSPNSATVTITDNDTQVIPLAFGQNYPYGIAVDSTSVYWVENAAGNVKKVDKNGGTVITLASEQGSPQDIAVDSTSVYWTDNNGATAIRKVGINGGTTTTLASPAYLNTGGIAVDSTSVYWTDSWGEIKKVDINGGTPTTLAFGQNNPSGILVDSNYVYWAEWNNSGTIKKVSINGGIVTVLASELNNPKRIAIDSNYVYWTETDSGTVKKVSINGGDVTVLASKLNSPSGIAVDPIYVYWAEGGSGTIKKVNINDRTVTTIASGLKDPTIIAIDTTSVYWTEPSGGTVKKVAKAEDTTDPNGSLKINNDAKYTNSASVSLNLSATDDTGVTGYYVSENSSTPLATAPGWESIPPNTNYSSDIPYNLSSGDGTKIVYVWYKDAAENISNAASDSIILDTIPPTTTASPAGGLYNSVKSVTLTCNDGPGSGYDKIYYTTDGTNPTTSSADYKNQITILTTTTLKFFCMDKAGNPEAVKTEIYTIDPIAPNTFITNQPPNISNLNSASFEFTSTEEGSTFQCQMDNGGYTACTSPKAYSGLTDGTHTFYVKATDAAGNTDPTPASYTWTIDTTAPTGSITINNGTPYTNSTSVNLTLSSTDDNGTVSQMCISNISSCSSWEAFATSKSWTLPPGDETKTVNAWFKDSAGNPTPSSNPYSDQIILDTTPPTTTASPKGGSFTFAQSITLSCNDGSGSGCDKIYYTTDGSTPTTSSSVYTSPINISATTTLKFFSMDKAGNSETMKTEVYTINTVTTTPDITANPTTLPFGKVNIDSSSERSVSVRNDGDANLVIGTITDPSLPFSKVSDNCSGQTLSSSSGCAVTIKFSPKSIDTFTTSFSIPSNDPDENPVIIALTGAGTKIDSPDITVLPSLDLSFLNISVGVTADQTITVKNDGTSDLTISSIASPLAPFSVVSDADNCSNHTLSPGQSCTIKIRFAPTATGTFNSSFNIQSNDPDENTVTLNLSGSANNNNPNPPTKPNLVEPVNGATGMHTTLTVKWEISTDADGDKISYRLHIGTDPSFAEVNPIILASVPDDNNSGMAMRYSMGIIGMLGIIAIGRLSSNRKKMGLFIIVIIMVTGFIFTSCGSSSGGKGNKNNSDNKSYESYTINLQPNTTYYWKVVADDGEGGVTESDTYSFTTER